MPTDHPVSAQGRALKRILATLPATLLYYGSALGALAIAASGPEGTASIIGNIGAGFFTTLITDIVKGQPLKDEEVRRRAEEAVRASQIADLLTEKAFASSFAHLLERLHTQEALDQDIYNALRVGLADVATRGQVEELKDLIVGLSLPTATGQAKAPRVYLSYDRGTGLSVAERLTRDLQASGVSVDLGEPDPVDAELWQVSSWHAIEQADSVLLLVTPGAVASRWCAEEWRHSLALVKPIYPVLAAGGPADIPSELRALGEGVADVRLRERYAGELDRLTSLIRRRSAAPAVVHGAPSLPSHYVLRADALQTLIERLVTTVETDGRRSRPRQGVHGMGGVGKSLLAAAVTQDYRVRRSFPDGVFWLHVGAEPRLSELWTQFARDLGQRRTFADSREARDFFEAQTQERRSLIILDDVWQSVHADSFLRLGSNCRILVTSRDAGVLAEVDAEPYALDVPGDSIAEAIFSGAARSKDLPASAPALREACGNLPLALAMVGTLLAGKPEAYWRDVLDALQAARLGDIAARFPEYPYPSLLAALSVSVDALPADVRERYLSLAIFPDDVGLPEGVLETYWQPATAVQVRASIATLVDRSLLSRDHAGRLMLHDLQLAYLRGRVSDAQSLHATFLARHNPAGRLWAEVPDNGYLYDFLVHHLLRADRLTEALTLFADTAWRDARYRASELRHDGYLFDLELLWSNVAEPTARRQIDAEAPGVALALCTRLALIQTTIHSLESNVPAALIVRAAETRAWDVQRAVSVIAHLRDASEQLTACIALLKTAGLPDDLAARLRDLSLRAADASLHSTFAYLKLLPVLEGPAQSRALAALMQRLTSETHSPIVAPLHEPLQALIGILPKLGTVQRGEAEALLVDRVAHAADRGLGLEIEMASKVVRPVWRPLFETLVRAAWVKDLLPYSQAWAETVGPLPTVADVQAIDDSEARRDALRRLTSLAPEADSEAAQRALMDQATEPRAGQAMTRLRRQILRDLYVREGFSVTDRLDVLEDRLNGLFEALPLLTDPVRGEAIAECQARIPDLINDAGAVLVERQCEYWIKLLPYLNEPQQSARIAHIQSRLPDFEFVEPVARCLVGLLPFVQPDARPPLADAALDRLNSLRDGDDSAQRNQREILTTVAPYLDATQVERALQSLSPYEDRYTQARALRHLTAPLSERHADWALECALRVPSRALQIEALSLLIPRLSFLKRGRVVANLAGLLTEAQQVHATSVFLGAASQALRVLPRPRQTAWTRELLTVLDSEDVDAQDVAKALVQILAVARGAERAAAQARALRVLDSLPELLRDWDYAEGLLAQLLTALDRAPRERALSLALAAVPLMETRAGLAPGPDWKTTRQLVDELAPLITREQAVDVLARVEACGDDELRVRMKGALWGRAGHADDESLLDGLGPELSRLDPKPRALALAQLWPRIAAVHQGSVTADIVAQVETLVGQNDVEAAREVLMALAEALPKGETLRLVTRLGAQMASRLERPGWSKDELQRLRSGLAADFMAFDLDRAETLREVRLQVLSDLAYLRAGRRTALLEYFESDVFSLHVFPDEVIAGMAVNVIQICQEWVW